MTTNDRNEVRKSAANAGCKDSAYDSNRQFNSSLDVRHTGDNRTSVNGTTYYGSSDAKRAIARRSK